MVKTGCSVVLDNPQTWRKAAASAGQNPAARPAATKARSRGQNGFKRCCAPRGNVGRGPRASQLGCMRKGHKARQVRRNKRNGPKLDDQRAWVFDRPSAEVARANIAVNDEDSCRVVSREVIGREADRGTLPRIGSSLPRRVAQPRACCRRRCRVLWRVWRGVQVHRRWPEVRPFKGRADRWRHRCCQDIPPPDRTRVRRSCSWAKLGADDVSAQHQPFVKVCPRQMFSHRRWHGVSSKRNLLRFGDRFAITVSGGCRNRPGNLRGKQSSRGESMRMPMSTIS